MNQLKEIKNKLIEEILSSDKKFISNSSIIFFNSNNLVCNPFNSNRLIIVQKFYKLDNGNFRVDYFYGHDYSRVLYESHFLTILQLFSLLQLQYILINSL